MIGKISCIALCLLFVLFSFGCGGSSGTAVVDVDDAVSADSDRGDIDVVAVGDVDSSTEFDASDEAPDSETDIVADNDEPADTEPVYDRDIDRADDTDVFYDADAARDEDSILDTDTVGDADSAFDTDETVDSDTALCPDGCFIDGECYENGEKLGETGDFACMVCDPDENSADWTAMENGESCNDENSCSYNDVCGVDALCGGTVYHCNDHGTCNGDGTCSCEPGYLGDTCDECADGLHYTVAGRCVSTRSQFVYRTGRGRYDYLRTAPWPTDITHKSWDADNGTIPFEHIDSATSLVLNYNGSDELWEVFSSGDSYIIWRSGNAGSEYFSCQSGWSCDATTCTCGVKTNDPGTLGDQFWGMDLPFTTEIGAMTIVDGLWILTAGTSYTLWDDANGMYYHGTGAEAGAGTIGDEWWPDDFPFSTIDAMTVFPDPDTPHDNHILMISGNSYVKCEISSGELTCGSAGSLNDSYWTYRWQKNPFAETGIDAMVSWWDISAADPFDSKMLILLSDSPLHAEITAGKFRIAEAENSGDEGPDQRVLHLDADDPFAAGYAHGYILAEEIMELHDQIVKQWYDKHSQYGVNAESVTVDGAEYKGYALMRKLASYLYDPDALSGVYHAYKDELEGMVAGIRANPFTQAVIRTSTEISEDNRVYSGANSRDFDWKDLMGTLILDELMGTNCKASGLWPDGENITGETTYQAYIMDWMRDYADYNMMIMYDYEDDTDRLTWVGTSLSGHIGGFLYSLNEKGYSFAGVASDWNLRSKDDMTGAAFLQKRIEKIRDIDIDVIPGTLLCRNTVEKTVSIQDGYDGAFEASRMGTASYMGTTYTLLVVAPAGGTDTIPGAAFEIVYPGAQDLWRDEGHIFSLGDACPPEENESDLCVYTSLREPDAPDEYNNDIVTEMYGYPVIITTPNAMRKIHIAPGETWGKKVNWYGEMRGDFRDAFIADTIPGSNSPGELDDSDETIMNIMKEQLTGNDPKIEGATTQFVLAHPALEGSENSSFFRVHFSHSGVLHAFDYTSSGTPSIRHYTWGDLFEMMDR